METEEGVVGGAAKTRWYFKCVSRACSDFHRACVSQRYTVRPGTFLAMMLMGVVLDRMGFGWRNICCLSIDIGGGTAATHRYLRGHRKCMAEVVLKHWGYSSERRT